MTEPEARRDHGLDVAVARVGRAGGRARWAAVAWAAALVGLVAVAIADRPTDSPPVAVTVAVDAPRRHADPGPVASALVRVLRVTAPRERTPGEDGLMGSLVLDLKPRDLSGRSWPVGKLGWTTNPAQS